MGRHWLREHRQVFDAWLDLQPSDVFVDVGCGDWQFSRLIDWSGIDRRGIDVSWALIKNIAR